MRIALAGWRQEVDGRGVSGWRPDCTFVGNNWGALDLRADPTQTSGFCIVVDNDATAAIPGVVRDLGDSVDAVQTSQTIQAIEQRLGVTLSPSATTLRQIVYELMTQWGTEDGTRWRPFRSSIDSGIMERTRIVIANVVFYDSVG